MMDHEITTPAELDSAIAQREAVRRTRLRIAAEGGSFGWIYILGTALGGVLSLVGLYGVLAEQDLSRAIQLASGIGLLCILLVRHQQTQIAALRELLQDFDHSTPMDSQDRGVLEGNPRR